MDLWIQIFTLRQIKCESDVSHCDVKKNEKGENDERKEGLVLSTHTYLFDVSVYTAEFLNLLLVPLGYTHVRNVSNGKSCRRCLAFMSIRGKNDFT
jgi:hypothetical protein